MAPARSGGDLFLTEICPHDTAVAYDGSIASATDYAGTRVHLVFKTQSCRVFSA